MSARIVIIEVPPDHWPTPVPSPYARAIATLRERCPDYVEEERWRQCIADAEGFIAGWGDQAAALGRRVTCSAMKITAPAGCRHDTREGEV
jgi:hypothetical protein